MKHKAAVMQSLQKTANEHASADKNCGRAWVCQCGACRIIRRAKHIKGNARR